MNIENFVKHKDLFIRELILNGMSKHTINAYNRDLTELFNNLENIPNCNSKSHIKKEYFIWCLKKLSQTNNHPRTIARKLSTWKSYFNFLLKNKLINLNLISTLKAPRQPNRLPKAINIEDIQSIFATKEKNDDFFIRRDNAIFELMYGTGIRLSELTNLNIDDVILDEGWMYIHGGKGNKDRQLPLGSKAIDAINNYLKIRPNINNQPALFISKNGTRISSRRVQQCLNEWGVRHNANQHLSPHMLRHSFATHILKNSHNIRAVQELLGHSQLSTTQIYTKLDMEYLLDVYNKSHPRAKKK